MQEQRRSDGWLLKKKVLLDFVSHFFDFQLNSPTAPFRLAASSQVASFSSKPFHLTKYCIYSLTCVLQEYAQFYILVGC
jgi:hypothetical protein